MSKNFILQPGQSYTFSSYFDLPYELHEVVAEFGYRSSTTSLLLPRADVDKERVKSLKTKIEEILPYVGLTSEIARREVFIAPVLFDAVYHTHARLSIEYPLNVTDQLKGTLDYYLHNNSNFLVVEAKRADLDRGFNQLAVELIALDLWLESDCPTIVGAVTTGSIWQFGQLHRAEKLIEQDYNTYRAPADVGDLLSILVAALI